MNNVKVIYVLVKNVRGESIAKLSGNNVREFTDVKLSFLFAR